MTKLYTRQDVSRHNLKNDLWIVIHDCVYDVTTFIMEHPGGEEVLLKLAGSDGTVCFDEIGHSAEALLLREKYKVGEIIAAGRNETSGNAAASSTGVEGAGPAAQEDDDWEYEEKKEETSSLLPVFIGLGVLVYAVIFYYLF